MANRIHISTALMMLSQPDPVTIDVFKANGDLVHMENCIGLRYDKYQGTRRVKMLQSGQIRQIRDCLIIRINDMEVYL